MHRSFFHAVVAAVLGLPAAALPQAHDPSQHHRTRAARLPTRARP